MKRREFIILVGGTVAPMPLAAIAQRSGIAVVGVLSPEWPNTTTVDGLVEGLRELGYFEGRNIRFEYRWAEGKFDRLPELAADLIRLKVDVIVAFVTKAAEDAKNQTGTIPIVIRRFRSDWCGPRHFPRSPRGQCDRHILDGHRARR
jgi:putative ABC transport system substrate-binding protein